MTVRVWTCKIGGDVDLSGGWGGELTEAEVAVVEDRLPDPDTIIGEYRAGIDRALEGIDAAERSR